MPRVRQQAGFIQLGEAKPFPEVLAGQSIVCLADGSLWQAERIEAVAEDDGLGELRLVDARSLSGQVSVGENVRGMIERRPRVLRVSSRLVSWSRLLGGG